MNRFHPWMQIDWLIVMGGPMSANDESKHGWLKAEKDFIGQALQAEKAILGVCLGSQLIADVLGSRVYKNSEPEIGWFPIQRSPEAAAHNLGKLFPQQAEVFHWHARDLRPAPRGLCTWLAAKPV